MEIKRTPVLDAGPTDTCPRCAARFDCGMASGHCWCAALPPLAALPPGLPTAYLCPACLRELSMRQPPDGAAQP